MELLGRGGHGEVWKARDELTRESVAVKFLNRRDASGRLDHVREVAALRLLRLPGVVRLLDEGEQDGMRYLVMELVPGEPFPGPHPTGAPDRRTWPLVERTLRQLLGILGRVHAAGLLHLDLKPANVLVDGDGRPTVLDLGLAAGRAFTPWDAQERRPAGTLRYAAPEQLLGRPADARADLHAVGVMLFECLTGRPPRPDIGEALYLTRLMDEHPPRVESLVPNVPPAVDALIAALLDPEPSRRPRSATDALARLEPTPAPEVRGLVESATADLHGRPLDLAALRSLFRGPDRLLHLAEDAARALHERTGGDPSSTARELESWVAAGLASWDGERLALDRRDLLLLADEHAAKANPTLDPGSRRLIHAARAAVTPPGTPGRLLDLVLAEEIEQCPAEAIAAGQHLLREGGAEQAAAVLFEGWVVLRDGNFAGDAPGEAALLSLWTSAALVSQDVRLLARLQTALADAAERDPSADRLARLAHAAQAALGTDGERALGRLDALGPCEDPGLERWRLAYRLYAARFVGRAAEERALADVEDFAERQGTPEFAAAAAALRGRYLYRAGRFAEAARSHAEACALDPDGAGALPARINAASAWMEHGDLEQARAQAEIALAQAAAARRPLLEAHATWIARSCAYRSGEFLPPDRELLAALEGLGHPDLEAQLRLHEAVLAWRNGELELARELSLQTAHHARERSNHGTANLAFLVAREAGYPLERLLLEAIATSVRGLDSPTLRLQLTALLARAGHPLSAEWREETRVAAAAHDPQRRWEVLSAGEVIEAL